MSLGTIEALFVSCSNSAFQASDETLHLVLETLQAAIRAGGFKHSGFKH